MGFSQGPSWCRLLGVLARYTDWLYGSTGDIRNVLALLKATPANGRKWSTVEDVTTHPATSRIVMVSPSTFFRSKTGRTSSTNPCRRCTQKLNVDIWQYVSQYVSKLLSHSGKWHTTLFSLFFFMFFIKKTLTLWGLMVTFTEFKDMTMKNKNYQYPNFAVNKMIMYKVSCIF